MSQDSHRQLASHYPLLDEHAVAVAERAQDRARKLIGRGDELDPDRRALRDWLDDGGKLELFEQPWEGPCAAKLTKGGLVEAVERRGGDAMQTEHPLKQHLVHAQRGGEWIRARIGNPERLEQVLQ